MSSSVARLRIGLLVFNETRASIFDFLMKRLDESGMEKQLPARILLSETLSSRI